MEVTALGGASGDVQHFADRIFAERGVRFLGPADGEMAERSHVGPGRMVEAQEIASAALRALRNHAYGLSAATLDSRA